MGNEMICKEFLVRWIIQENFNSNDKLNII